MMRVLRWARELNPVWWWIAGAAILLELVVTVPGWVKSGDSWLVLGQVMAAKAAFVFAPIAPLVLAIWAWDSRISKWPQRWVAWVVIVLLWFFCALSLDIGFSLVPGVGEYYSNMSFYYPDSDVR